MFQEILVIVDMIGEEAKSPCCNLNTLIAVEPPWLVLSKLRALSLALFLPGLEMAEFEGI